MQKKYNTAAGQCPDEAPEVVTKAMCRLAELWQLDASTLAAILHITPHAAGKLLKQQRVLKPSNTSEWDRALLIIRAFRSLDAVMGNHLNNERAWLTSHNSLFQRTPLEAMESTQGLVHVVEYLDAIRGH